MQPFTIEKKSKKSRARRGVLRTAHGEVQTPSFVPVATKGTMKSLMPEFLKDIGVQLAFVNTFHLTLSPGVDVLKKFGGIHAYANLEIPLMSDSAGFQVFSLGDARRRKRDEAPLVKITEEGVKFRSPKDGQKLMLTPELSIQNQEKIGADILMAFDECVYHGAGKEYTAQAKRRTHRWLLRCIEAKKRKDQLLYGIVQGGGFRDLREDSAKFIAKQDIQGIAIGGVSVGETKKEMREQVKWSAPHLPEELPRHLLGVGRVEDILDLVKEGMDTFDCVEPTRIARNGILYTKKGRIDMAKQKFLKDKSPIERGCACHTCQHYSRSFLCHLFRERELLAYTLASWHNLFFFERLFANIREDIEQGKL